jgi:D-xylose transport system permease protein
MSDTMELSTKSAVAALDAARFRERLSKWMPLVAFVAIVVTFQWASQGAFLTPRNLSNLARQICVNGLLATGMTYVILTAGIDLSVGSVLALASMMAALTQVAGGWSEWGVTGAALSVFVALALGAMTGATTGALVSRLRITPFIVSLAMMVVCRGLTLILSGAQAVAPLGDALAALSSDYVSPGVSAVLLVGAALVGIGLPAWSVWSGRVELWTGLRQAALVAVGLGAAGYAFVGYRGIPYMVLVFAACFAVAAAVLHYTRFGRFLYAIGGNREAAELSGVPVSRVLFVTYLLMGLFAGLAGVLDAARVNGAVPSAGELAELDAIAAVVIGGTSLMGGVGTLGGTLLGVLIMGALNNGMSLVGVNEHSQKVFKGIVILLAVYFDIRSKKKG